jgi:hypothetical protein
VKANIFDKPNSAHGGSPINLQKVDAHDAGRNKGLSTRMTPRSIIVNKKEPKRKNLLTQLK